jgi:hypothetical protein
MDGADPDRWSEVAPGGGYRLVNAFRYAAGRTPF